MEPAATRITSDKLQEDDLALETTLRPRRLDEFIGQENIKAHLPRGTPAPQRRQEPLDHHLLYGPPGLGKTTLAHIIAHEMSVSIRVTSGPAIERAGDLAAILTNLQESDILFIDEVHRLPRAAEEVLYPAMEDFALDIVLGRGPGARSVRLSVPRFTLIGATTRYAMLSPPLRDRFGAVYRLDFYDGEGMAGIVRGSAAILGMPPQGRRRSSRSAFWSSGRSGRDRTATNDSATALRLLVSRRLLRDDLRARRT